MEESDKKILKDLGEIKGVDREGELVLLRLVNKYFRINDKISFKGKYCFFTGTNGDQRLDYDTSVLMCYYSESIDNVTTRLGGCSAFTFLNGAVNYSRINRDKIKLWQNLQKDK